MTTLRTRLKIENWDEQGVEDLPGGGSVKRADVTLGAGPDGLGPGTMRSLLHYAADGTSTYVTLLHVEGTLAGKAGSLVLLGEGTYDGTTASGRLRVLEGTGGLVGVTDTATSDSTAADYPAMPVALEYEGT